jgi:hypothetical protein
MQGELLAGAAESTLLVVLSFLLGVLVLVSLRFIGKFPSELDRIGSDLNLYGYGISLSFVFGLEAGRPILRCLEPRWIPLAVAASLVLTLILYALNLQLSQRIRKMNPWRYSDGLETWEDLKDVCSSPAGKVLFKRSLILGFFPALTIVLLDILG